MKRTIFYLNHVAAGARIVDFAGWEMPIQYPGGIIQEHLTTRKAAGLFDVSHMGRFEIAGAGAREFLRYVLTNDAAALPVGMAHYTLIANEQGGAIDDAFLYRFYEDRWLLVVNASNKEKDWAHLEKERGRFADVSMADVSESMAMIAVQGPRSEEIVAGLMEGGSLPAANRNALGEVVLAGQKVLAGRTGYTGEPVCFELFLDAATAPGLWDKLVERGAAPVGLGARDTLRLEASLPLYGHEYGTDPEGREIPIAACPTAKFGVSFEDEGRDFIGKAALQGQYASLKDKEATGGANFVERIVRPVRIIDKGIGRPGAKVVIDGKDAGWLVSGTAAPYWKVEGQGAQRVLTDEKDQRSVGLALVDRRTGFGDCIQIEVRGRFLEAKVVKRNLDNRSGPVTFAVFE